MMDEVFIKSEPVHDDEVEYEGNCTITEHAPMMVLTSPDHELVPSPSVQISGAFGPFSSSNDVAARPLPSQIVTSEVAIPALSIPPVPPPVPPTPIHTTNTVFTSQEETIEVGGFHIHCMEAERARQILSHYPDIGVACVFATPKLQTVIFESLLNAVHILEDKPIHALTLERIHEARLFATDARLGGLRVDWLLAQIEELTEMKKRSEVLVQWEALMAEVQELTQLMSVEERLQRTEVILAGCRQTGAINEEQNALSL